MQIATTSGSFATRNQIQIDVYSCTSLAAATSFLTCPCQSSCPHPARKTHGGTTASCSPKPICKRWTMGGNATILQMRRHFLLFDSSRELFCSADFRRSRSATTLSKDLGFLTVLALLFYTRFEPCHHISEPLSLRLACMALSNVLVIKKTRVHRAGSSFRACQPLSN